MTIPNSPFTRFVLRGDIGGTQSWSTSFAMAPPPGTVSQSTLSGILASVSARAATWWNATTGGIGARNTADTRLLGVDAYLYGGGSGAPASLQASIDYATPLVGGSSTAHPTQTSIVVTLLTGLPGRSFRGRMYLPMTGGALGSNHQLVQANVTDYAAAAKAFMDGVNSDAVVPDFGRVSVAGSAGPIPVTSVRVDSEPDVQRRRANKIQAAFYGIGTLA